MGYESKIQVLREVRLKYNMMSSKMYSVPSHVAKKIVQDEEEAESSTQSIRIEESLLWSDSFSCCSKIL